MKSSNPSPELVARTLNFLREALRDSAWAERVWLVGGCVRDESLGRPTRDLDLVVEQANGAHDLTHELAQKFPRHFSRPHHLGAGYPIWQIVFRDPDGPAGSAGSEDSAGSEGSGATLDLEIADTQREMFPDPTTRQRVTRYGNLEEDCLRRDFTVNMLYRNVVDGRLRDPSGCGERDITDGCLREHPGADARKMFSDDPLRMLRLFRFAAHFGWRIAESLTAPLPELAARVNILSVERVREEMQRLICAPHASEALAPMARVGLLLQILPELRELKGDLSSWTSNFAPAPLGESTGPSVNWALFLWKAKLDAAPLRRWKFSRELIRRVEGLMGLGARAEALVRSSDLLATRRWIRDAAVEGFADSAGGGGGGNGGGDELANFLKARLAADFDEWRSLVSRASAVPVALRSPLDGRAIMEVVGGPASPRIKLAQSFLLDLHDELALRGESLSGEQAEGALRRWWSDSLV